MPYCIHLVWHMLIIFSCVWQLNDHWMEKKTPKQYWISSSFQRMLMCVTLSDPDRNPAEIRQQSGGPIVCRLFALQSLGSGSELRESPSRPQAVPVLRLQRLPQWPPGHGQSHPWLQTWRVSHAKETWTYGCLESYIHSSIPGEKVWVLTQTFGTIRDSSYHVAGNPGVRMSVIGAGKFPFR